MQKEDMNVEAKHKQWVDVVEGTELLKFEGWEWTSASWSQENFNLELIDLLKSHFQGDL